MKRLLVCTMLACAIVIAGCGRKKTKIAIPAPAPPAGTSERGLASWYGHPYHGRQAADQRLIRIGHLHHEIDQRLDWPLVVRPSRSIQKQP